LIPCLKSAVKESHGRNHAPIITPDETFACGRRVAVKILYLGIRIYSRTV